MAQEPAQDEREMAGRFRLRAAASRRIDFSGPPVTKLPEWGGVAGDDGVRFILHPPIDFELAYCIPHYFVFTPFARAVADVSIGDGTVRRRSWAAGSAFVVPPETLVRARMEDAVEFLCMTVEPERAEAVIGAAARGRRWAPQVIEEFADSGFAALQQEVRRSLLGDPLVEPAYLGALADAMMARLACAFLGQAIGREVKEALSPHLLHRILRHVDDQLCEKIAVEDLAAEAGLSRSHFSRAFQAATGEAPRDFIIGRRLSKARDLLAQTDLGIAEIAVQTGFSSQAHLSTAFKKRLGLSPARYRAAFR
ncbi:helix-turn-helix domain-containing protein [Pontivivens ytuae]|uniref:Helix-turn-helix transcriptional regulator n=1 Tax=Pontivivens ytuae TaxID=2789856 RepID=A0A7S9LTF9_9RHOB|nr:AraC family transcriptional regulator [Pontivivens ytuae]QPH54814.1 helix-turn-helix transcriptional regulator [Pontivivens ytuae]